MLTHDHLGTLVGCVRIWPRDRFAPGKPWECHCQKCGEIKFIPRSWVDTLRWAKDHTASHD